MKNEEFNSRLVVEGVEVVEEVEVVEGVLHLFFI
jgi:hypothetical protein